MTIAALLAHHGISRPRWVDVDGRLIFAEPPEGAPAAIAVKRHTFHGGDDPVEKAAADSWWDDASELERHRSEMEKYFPTFRFVPAEGESGPAWIGQIDTGRGRFRVAILTRRDRSLPRVELLGTKTGRSTRFGWKNSPHTYLSGAPCIADQSDWNPGSDTVATAAAWTAHWLAAYTEWRLFGTWPVEGFEPDAVA